MTKRIVSFESLGGVGDGNSHTGAGTDNAEAFERCVSFGEMGYRVVFPAGKTFKTTRSIIVHNMDWLGDMTNPPTIFGWFDGAGSPVITRNKVESRKSALIHGIRFHRCGPHPEHGIVVDNMASFDFDGWVSAISADDESVRGGAIGVSPFEPAHRPSSNVKVKARISNSANFGIQFGNVTNGTIQVFAQNCMREVIGIEPYCLGIIDLASDDISGDRIAARNHKLSTGHPLIYTALGEGESIEGLPRANYWFAIVLDKDSIQLAESEDDAAAGKPVRLGSVPPGLHRLYVCGVADTISILPSRINNINPPTENVVRSLDGVIVLTATSGGYVRNIDTGTVVVSDIENRAAGYCVSLLGLWGVTLSGLDLRGGRIGGIRVGRGALGGLRGRDGTSINPPRLILLLPRNILVTDNQVVDFPTFGINALDGGTTVTDNFVSSHAKNAVGIRTAPPSVPRTARASKETTDSNRVIVPNGDAYRVSDPEQRD